MESKCGSSNSSESLRRTSRSRSSRAWEGMRRFALLPPVPDALGRLSGGGVGGLWDCRRPMVGVQLSRRLLARPHSALQR